MTTITAYIDDIIVKIELRQKALDNIINNAFRANWDWQSIDKMSIEHKTNKILLETLKKLHIDIINKRLK